MSMRQQGTVVTPEAVSVEADYAGLGSRLVGAVIDGLIQTGFLLILVIGISSAQPSDEVAIVVFVIALFLAVWGYPIVFEAAWAGQTPGKRAAKIRVMRTDGQPVRFSAVLVRNLLRIVDLLPGVYGVGAISIMVTHRAQRLGDLAAGTVVVHDVSAAVPQALVLVPDDTRRELARTLDPAELSAQEYALVRSFLVRRDGLAPEARRRLADDLARRLRDRVRGSAEEDSEKLLEAIVESYRGSGV